MAVDGALAGRGKLTLRVPLPRTEPEDVARAQVGNGILPHAVEERHGIGLRLIATSPLDRSMVAVDHDDRPVLAALAVFISDR